MNKRTLKTMTLASALGFAIGASGVYAETPMNMGTDGAGNAVAPDASSAETYKVNPSTPPVSGKHKKKHMKPAATTPDTSGSAAQPPDASAPSSDQKHSGY